MHSERAQTQINLHCTHLHHSHPSSHPETRARPPQTLSTPSANNAFQQLKCNHHPNNKLYRIMQLHPPPKLPYRRRREKGYGASITHLRIDISVDEKD